MNWYSVHHLPPCSSVVRCLDKNVTDCPFSFYSVGYLCVQFGTEAVCFTFILHVLKTCGLYHLQDANSKLKEYLETAWRVNELEQGILRTRNEEMLHELEALKVSVA